MSCQNCFVCSTPLKIKGLIMSVLLVSTAVATSVLTYTTNCSQVIQISGNSTQTLNDIGSANRAVSISLVFFSVASAIFERHVNKRLVETEEEISELKTQLSVSRNVSQRDDINEPIPTIETRRSDDTVYPPIVSFQKY